MSCIEFFNGNAIENYIIFKPAEYSHDILGDGWPLAEHGSRIAAPADTEVFWARHTHVGGSMQRDCFKWYIIQY